MKHSVQAHDAATGIHQSFLQAPRTRHSSDRFLFSGLAQLWALQGIALASKGDNKEVLPAFQRALKASPNNLAALAGAAQIEYQEGKPGAAQHLNHLLELRPAEPTAHAMLAVLEYRKGNCDGALPHFEKAGEVAVGTPVTQRPPHGSGRALASASGSYRRGVTSKRK
jgi:tetratricopeptide (TPR) repeat protein